MDAQDDSLELKSIIQPGSLLRLPAIFAINELYKGNPLQQLLVPEQIATAVKQDLQTNGWLCALTESNDNPVLITTSDTDAIGSFQRVVRVQSYAEFLFPATAQWIQHPALADVPLGEINYCGRVQQASESWREQFSYTKAEPG